MDIVPLMTHVSKVPVDEQVYKTIRKDLRNAVSAKRAKGPEILEALLSKAERTMLAKRLAAIILLENGNSYYRVSKLLKVSVSTAMRLDRYRRQGRYSAICRRDTPKAHSGKLTFLEEAELLLSMGMPPMGGPSAKRRRTELLKKRKQSQLDR
jgi:hypothetical protein